jgi:hypothetical protein
MKSLNLIHILIGIVCLRVLPQMQAVTPAPDGGYPGGNTAEGQSALLNLSSGGYNTAVGFSSLSAVATGAFNTGIGAGVLLANTRGPEYGHWCRCAPKQHHWRLQHG